MWGLKFSTTVEFTRVLLVYILICLVAPTVIMLISLRMKIEYSKCPINNYLKSPEKNCVANQGKG